jgi:Spy/CpxP family protein refolding chaperone
MGPLEVLAQALGLATEIVKFNEKMFDASTPEQKQQQIQFNIDNQKFWQDIISRLTPKG